MRLLWRSLLIAGVFAIFGCANSSPSAGGAAAGTNLEARYPTGVAVVYFYSSSCSSCKVQDKHNPEIAAALDGLGVTYAKINPNSTTIKRYNLTRYPTLVVLKNGSITWRRTGVVYKEDLLPVVRGALGK